MGLTKLRYGISLAIQFSFIILDITCNLLADQVVVRKDIHILFVVYLIQDGMQLFGITTLCVCAFYTNLFEAGFGSLLMDRFMLTIVLSLVYLLSTAALQTIILLQRWDTPLKHVWPPGITLLYILQRSVSVLYFYFYKRATLKLSDPRYYDVDWLKHTLNHH